MCISVCIETKMTNVESDKIDFTFLNKLYRQPY